jgi:drug/metabolite transporter (DMT)-like permease
MAGVRTSGTVLCLLSGCAFGAMGVFGKLAYDNGATVGTLLSARFTLAALLFWALGAARELAGLRRRDLLIALALGAGCYAAQAGGYFAALQRIDVSVLGLLIYTYPAMVAAGAVALRRERLDARRLWALALVSGGVVLLLASAATVHLDALGVTLGLVTAGVYSVYVLSSQGVSGRVRPRALAALVCTGAAFTLTAGAAALGELRPGAVTATGWAWLACLAVVSTVAAISLFFAGLSRVGPTTAAILSTAEPLTTVVLAFVVFGELLTPVQLAGGGLVLGGVLVLSGRASRRIGGRRGMQSRPGRAAEQCTPHAGEAGGQCGEELAQRAHRPVVHEHRIDLRDGTRAGLVAPGDVEVLTADDLRQVDGEDDVGVRVVDGQV